MNTYHCILDLGKVFPVREAKNKEEFIANLLDEYNTACDGLFDVKREDISEITSDKVIQICEADFVEWSLEGFNSAFELYAEKPTDKTIPDFCLERTQEVPIQHITNWDAIKEDLARHEDGGYLYIDSIEEDYEVVFVHEEDDE
jgi:hypothetical protein